VGDDQAPRVTSNSNLRRKADLRRERQAVGDQEAAGDRAAYPRPASPTRAAGCTRPAGRRRNANPAKARRKDRRGARAKEAAAEPGWHPPRSRRPVVGNTPPPFRKNIAIGQAHTRRRSNNTIVSLNDGEGKVIPGGFRPARGGFKGSRSRRRSPAQVGPPGRRRGARAWRHGLQKGRGLCQRAWLRAARSDSLAWQAAGLEILGSRTSPPSHTPGREARSGGGLMTAPFRRVLRTRQGAAKARSWPRPPFGGPR